MSGRMNVSRLRNACYWAANGKDRCRPGRADTACLYCETADELERLTQEVERLRGMEAKARALWGDWCVDGWSRPDDDLKQILGADGWQSEAITGAEKRLADERAPESPHTGGDK